MAYDGKFRAKCKALYQAGKSFEQIRVEVSRLGKVSKPTLVKWAEEEQWKKGESLPVLIQKETAALEAEAERHGVTKAKVFAKISKLMDAKSLAVITTQGAVSLCPTTEEQVTGDNKGEFMGIEYNAVDDRATQLAATKLAADVLGLKKIQVDPSDEFRGFYASLRANG